MDMEEDYRAVIKAAALEEETFLKLTLSRRLRDDNTTPWVRISVRPVLIQGERRMQFSYFDATKDITKNFPREEAEPRLDEILGLPFGRVHLQSTSGDLHVKITRKGKALLSKGKPSRSEPAPVLSHDRVKRQPLEAKSANRVLKALGILTKRGTVRAALRGKFNQINEFIRILDQVLPERDPPEPVRIVDCGCGSAYLTFAAYHYLTEVRERAVRVVGVDTNEELIAKCVGLRDSLGWDGLEFHVSGIAAFEPDRPPDVVLSLHACDTATDEAIARGVQWESAAILAAPCCQHELHHQLDAPPFRAVLRHGILRERLADIVTDAFRALALRIMGYRTSVIEFISPESTSKNLMIRAERGDPEGVRPGDPALANEFSDLKRFWNASPAIERLLGEPFRALLGGGATEGRDR